MKTWSRLIVSCLPCLLLACTLSWLTTATPTPSEPRLTIDGIMQDPAAYSGQLVQVQGYGITMMTMPLCLGYVGMDTRTVFIDTQDASITTEVQGDTFEAALYGNTRRDFLGYVRIYSGEQGCPGDVGMVTFPYFEIVEVVEAAQP
jgi:hypothetical protein